MPPTRPGRSTTRWRRSTTPGSRPRHKPSVLQGVERGRAPEIDTMARIVPDFAREAGVATPALDTVLARLVRLARTLGIHAGEG